MDQWLPIFMQKVATVNNLPLQTSATGDGLDIHKWKAVIGYDGSWTGKVIVQFGSIHEILRMRNSLHGQGIEIQQHLAGISVDCDHLDLRTTAAETTMQSAWLRSLHGATLEFVNSSRTHAPTPTHACLLLINVALDPTNTISNQPPFGTPISNFPLRTCRSRRTNKTTPRTTPYDDHLPLTNHDRFLSIQEATPMSVRYPIQPRCPPPTMRPGELPPIEQETTPPRHAASSPPINIDSLNPSGALFTGSGVEPDPRGSAPPGLFTGAQVLLGCAPSQESGEAARKRRRITNMQIPRESRNTQGHLLLALHYHSTETLAEPGGTHKLSLHPMPPSKPRRTDKPQTNNITTNM